MLVGEILNGCHVKTRNVPIITPVKWAVDPYKDARHIPGNASPRRKKGLLARFKEFGFDKRFILLDIPDSEHIRVECIECGNVFTRNIACLNRSKTHNIECCRCGIHADGTRSNPRSEVKRNVDESEIVDFYNGGYSATQTAKKFGMNLRRVRRIIDDAGISLNTQATLEIEDYPTDLTGDPWMDERFTCAECGREFTRHQHALVSGYATDESVRDRRGRPVKYCSPRCSQKVQNRKHKHTRRQREIAGKSDIIPLDELIKRDGGICQICGEEVDLDDGWFDTDRHFHIGRLYPTIDHIVPLAKGGTTTWDNVQLAHLACNSAKCDRIREDSECQE